MALGMPNPFRKITVYRKKYNSVSFTTTSIFKTNNVKSGKAHKYVSKWNYNNIESTYKHLLKQVIYHQDGVVAINKPIDLGSSKRECSLYPYLPYLAEELGHKYLKLVSVPEKSVSGVTLLAGNESIASRLGEAIRRSKAVYSNEPKQTFLAVTVGHPNSDNSVSKYAVAKEYHQKEHHPVILRTWGQNEVKRREVNYGTVSHNVLAKSELASLVSISTWQLRLHFPRLFLSDVLLSPALGDQIFGPRVGSLLGKPCLIKPWLTPAVKSLPPLLLQKLLLRSGSESLVPLHFHLHELTLCQFFKDKSDLVITADPPDFFQWTCQQLNLEMPHTFKSEQSEKGSDQRGMEDAAYTETDENNLKDLSRLDSKS